MSLIFTNTHLAKYICMTHSSFLTSVDGTVAVFLYQFSDTGNTPLQHIVLIACLWHHASFLRDLSFDMNDTSNYSLHHQRGDHSQSSVVKSDELLLKTLLASIRRQDAIFDVAVAAQKTLSQLTPVIVGIVCPGFLMGSHRQTTPMFQSLSRGTMCSLFSSWELPILSYNPLTEKWESQVCWSDVAIFVNIKGQC